MEAIFELHQEQDTRLPIPEYKKHNLSKYIFK